LTESASERIRIEASSDRCFDVAIDFESYPEWVRDVKEARIIERDAEGRGERVEYRAAALGRSVRYVLGYDYSNAPSSFSWELVEGDMLRRLDGSYRFEPEGDASTRVHYELSVDLAVPLPGLLKRRAAGLIMGSALKELKKQVEAVA
jgi:ribosome-associated toxin RatA of RatAB toxin-antitoxin module